jgi:hypothetical protein
MYRERTCVSRRRQPALGEAAFVLLLAFILLGCRVKPVYVPMAGSYYLNPDVDLSKLGRVALVEFDNRSSYPEMPAALSDGLFVALQKKQQFGLFEVAKSEPVWRSLQLDAESAWTPEVLLEMRGALRCDAVLTGVLTQYEPYPHTTVGLRMRLVDLRDGKLLWAVEQVWDGSDQRIRARIREYRAWKNGMSKAAGGEEMVVVSSRKFIQFVAYEVGETL